MNRILISILLILLAWPAAAALYDQNQINALNGRESSGIKAYQKGDYETAFDILSKTATKGLKDSQYLVALMFMKGEGVNKSMLVGLGWLGVSIESGNEEWINTWDTVYGALNDAQKAMVDDQVQRYKEKYGGRVQGVTCERRTAAGTKRIQLRCDKVAGTYPEYEIELVP